MSTPWTNQEASDRLAMNGGGNIPVIVDAHAHVFESIRGATRGGPTASGANGKVFIGAREVQALPASFERSSFPVDALLALLDSAHVNRAVILQGPYYGEENAYVAEACRGFPQRFTGMAFMDPWREEVSGAFDRLRQAAAFRGVKLECSEPTGLLGLHPGRRLDEPGLHGLWQGLEQSQGVLTLDLGEPGSSAYQTDAVRTIASAHPGIRVVVCHLGQPTAEVIADPRLRRAWEEQLSLARLANVWFDTAALPAFCLNERFPWPFAGTALRRALDLVGPHKILWGSDVPGVLVHGSYQQLLTYAWEALSSQSGADLDRVFGGNAIEVYGAG
jgi:predicted TIM-barrel fold metal-dependent hydrolase